MAERLKPLRGDGAKLLKLVTEALDLQTLEQALELGAALGQPARQETRLKPKNFLTPYSISLTRS